MSRILIVDDDPQMRFFLAQALKKEAYEVDIVADATGALQRVRSDSYALVLMDVRLPDMNGLDAVREVKKQDPKTVVIVMTAYGSRDTALEAIKRGAYDYFTKPFKVEELRIVIRRALDKVELSKQVEKLKRQLRDREKFGLMVGQSEKFLEMLQRLEKLCRVESTVLLTGESGTGKELAAQAIHENSPRAKKPFIKVNCAAIPETLLESELFGYRKGAFTDASKDKPGKFQAADGGTLLLDEIGDMNLELQSKILRALEQNEVERVGSVIPEKVDVRIIASTNQNLEKMVEEGRMRQDLYYRLAVFQIELPPLRERIGDVPLLARHFMRMYSEWLDKPVTGITDDAMVALNSYEWPGNVRELKNCIEVATTMTESDMIDVGDLTPQVVGKGASEDALHGSGTMLLDDTLARIEKRLIIDALRKTGGVQSRAAEMLGINERSMWHRVKKYGIDVNSLRS